MFQSVDEAIRAQGGWYRADDGYWRHAPPWKRRINNVLRWLQHGRPYCLLVITKSPDVDDTDEPPEVLGYGFGWIEMRWDS